MKRLLAWCLVPLALVGVLVAVACNDTEVHILSGQLYVPQDHCVEPVTGFDVVNGGTVSNSCAPTCLTVGGGDASATYVTDICGPYPGDYTVEAEDAAADAADPCTGAFQAYLSDGGLCPADLPEGGPAGDAGADAPQDAPPGG